MLTKVSSTQVCWGQSSCRGSSAREQGHPGVRGHGMGARGSVPRRCMLGITPAKQLWSLSETSGDRWEQALPEALAAFWALLQNSSLREQDVPALLADEEGLLPSHLHVLWLRWTQFLLINISASAMPPVPLAVFDTFRSQTYPPSKRATESYLQKKREKFWAIHKNSLLPGDWN